MNKGGGEEYSRKKNRRPREVFTFIRWETKKNKIKWMKTNMKKKIKLLKNKSQKESNMICTF